MNSKNVVWRSVCLLMPVCLVTAYCLVQRTRSVARVSFQQREAAQVVAALEDGALQPDARGIVTLPSRWMNIAKDGRVFVTRDKVGISQVLLATSRTAIGTGTDADVSGYIYSRRVLRNGDSATHAGPNDFGWMSVVSPKPMTTEPRWPGTAGRTEVFVCKQLNSHWYEFCTDTGDGG